MSRLAMDRALLAVDRAGRFFDADGRLHVPVSHISKANVCPYLGREIPDFEALGLEPGRVYRLWRHPEELARAAPSFNNIPLLDLHVAVSADDPKKDRIVGSTGTDAAFSAPYLDNSLVVWDAAAIELVETGEQRELSCAYRYRADMTAGVSAGEAYDGIMRDIEGNHVALVEVGRAGHDVIVGDSKRTVMAAKLKSRKALMTSGALAAYMRPKLAQDAKIDLAPALADVTFANFTARKPAIVAAVKKAAEGKLAQDADLQDLHKLLDSLDDEGSAEDDCLAAKDEESEEDKKAREAKEAADKKAKDAKAKKARDEETEAEKAEREKAEAEDAKRAKDEEEKGKAMDAAIRSATDATVKRMNAIREAERAVRPYVGELKVAFDTAAEVFKFALDTLGVDVDGVDPSAFAAVLRAQPKPGEPDGRKLAQDRAVAAGSLEKKFPNLGRISRS